jgi:hypothetical protein
MGPDKAARPPAVTLRDAISGDSDTTLWEHVWADFAKSIPVSPIFAEIARVNTSVLASSSVLSTIARSAMPRVSVFPDGWSASILSKNLLGPNRPVSGFLAAVAAQQLSTSPGFASFAAQTSAFLAGIPSQPQPAGQATLAAQATVTATGIVGAAVPIAGPSIYGVLGLLAGIYGGMDSTVSFVEDPSQRHALQLILAIVVTAAILKLMEIRRD